MDFDREGRPKLAHVVGRLVENGKRVVANHGNDQTLALLASGTREPIGKAGTVSKGSGGRNLFSLHQASLL